MENIMQSGIDPAEISKNMIDALSYAQELNYRLECADMIEEIRILRKQARCFLKTLALVQNNIEISQYETGRVRPVRFNVSETVDDLTSMVRSRMRRSGISIECEAEKGLIGFADPDRFSNCLINLIVNALQGVDQEEGRVLVTVKKRFDVAAVSVSDNGYAMTQQELDDYLAREDDPHGFGILKKFCESVGTAPTLGGTENGGFKVTVKVPLAPPDDMLEMKSDYVPPKMEVVSSGLVLLYKLDDATVTL